MEERKDIGVVSIDNKGLVHLDFLIDSKYFDDIDMVALQNVVDHLQIIVNHVAKNIEGDKDDE
jgi:hypothetical protein